MSSYDNWRSNDERAEYEAALDHAVESRACEMWKDDGSRVDLIETIALGDSAKLVAALNDGDFRRFARLLNDAGYEEAEADLERKYQADELDHGADLFEEKAA